MTDYYRSVTDDPYINIALEEKLFRERKRTVFLWVNRECVIAGRNQNFLAEADLVFAKKNNILPVRRYTGGGCVFHDHGNLNYSFIIPEEEQTQSLNLVLEVLREAGVPAQLSGRNDLMAAGRKCGGTAWQYDEGWMLFHGTILVDTDLAKMTRVLTPPALKLRGKGIESVRSRVVNLKELCPDISVETLRARFETHFGTHIPEMRVKEICGQPDITAEAAHLRSRQWLLGEEPEYETGYDIKTDRGILHIELCIRSGYISDVKSSHDYMDAGYRFPDEELIGKVFDSERIYATIQSLAYK